jgi:hypothetical protein
MSPKIIGGPAAPAGAAQTRLETSARATPAWRSEECGNRFMIHLLNNSGCTCAAAQHAPLATDFMRVRRRGLRLRRTGFVQERTGTGFVAENVTNFRFRGRISGCQSCAANMAPW